MSGKRIPIAAAKRVAQEYDYDCVVVFAWADDGSGSWRTTYGRTKEYCRRAARVGEFITETLTDPDVAALMKLRDNIDAEIKRRTASNQ